MPAAVRRARSQPSGSAHVTIALGRSGSGRPIRSRKRGRQPDRVVVQLARIERGEQRERRLGADERLPRRRHVEAAWRPRRARPRGRSTTTTDRRRRTSPRTAAACRPRGAPTRVEERDARAARTATCRRGRSRASKSDAATGSHPTAWVASHSVRAPARRAAATMAAASATSPVADCTSENATSAVLGADLVGERGERDGCARARPRPEWTNGRTIDEKSPSAMSTSAPIGSDAGDERRRHRRLRSDRDAVRRDADERREVAARALDGGRVGGGDPGGPRPRHPDRR